MGILLVKEGIMQQLHGFQVLCAALVLTCLASAQDPQNTCQSFGVDFLNGGSYFQNSNSNESFSATQEFEGCQQDVSLNFIVDPNGYQSQCSDTPLTPDDTPQRFTCPQWPKARMFSGDWSLLVLSNNGKSGAPIAYQRDFRLAVGPQQTVTATPTVTVTETTTPITTSYTTFTSAVTTTLVPSTTVVWASDGGYVPTMTSIPLPWISKETWWLSTRTRTRKVPQPTNQLFTATATCGFANGGRRRQAPDIVATIHITMAAANRMAPIPRPTRMARHAAASFDHLPKYNIVKRDLTLADSAQRRLFKRARAARLLHARAPDAETITLTVSNTASYSTTTTTVTAPTTVTALVSTTVFTTVTQTPPVVTITRCPSNSLSAKPVPPTHVRQHGWVTQRVWEAVRLMEEMKQVVVVVSITKTIRPSGVCTAK